ncbi:bifunctional adenosylcobinamide kinase/adenosylcobinamide-phosphate guanylyltransferase [Thermodesulfobacteriota bacterium]
MSGIISKKLIFILGGARSGKSSWALHYAESNYEKLLFVATAEITDEEMANKVRLHKESRGDNWRLLEEPLDIAKVIKDGFIETDVILIDCMTIWLNNVLFKRGEDTAELYVKNFIEALKSRSNAVIIVANEVGTGVVPEHKSGRVFRDLAGRLNQRIAAVADRVVYIIAGIPLDVKGGE